MNTLAPPSVPAHRPGGVDGLEPPAPSQAAVPAAFASLTWPADLAATKLPAPTVAPWSAPAAKPPFDPPVAGQASGWNWQPIMEVGDESGDEVAAPPSLRAPDGSLAIELGALEAVFDARAARGDDDNGGPVVASEVTDTEVADTDVSDASHPHGRAQTMTGPATPAVSFEPEMGSLSTEVTATDTAIVTATVPAFVTYAPATELILPEAPPREPVAVEVREMTVHVPRQRPVRRRRSGRASAVVLVLAAAVSAAAYIGFREYIYGDTDVASDGTRVVEVEPVRTIVVVDAP